MASNDNAQGNNAQHNLAPKGNFANSPVADGSSGGDMVMAIDGGNTEPGGTAQGQQRVPGLAPGVAAYINRGGGLGRGRGWGRSNYWSRGRGRGGARGGRGFSHQNNGNNLGFGGQNTDDKNNAPGFGHGGQNSDVGIIAGHNGNQPNNNNDGTAHGFFGGRTAQYDGSGMGNYPPRQYQNNRGRGSVRGTYGGITKKTADKDLRIIPKMNNTTYSDPTNSKEVMVSGSAPVGGRQGGMVSYMERGSATVFSSNADDHANLVRQLQRDTGVRTVHSIMQPVYDGTRRRAERRQLIREVRSSMDFEVRLPDRIKRGVVEDVTDKPEGNEVEAPAKTPAEICGNCKKTGHTIRHCLMAPEGVIPGCIFCNTTDHGVELCGQYNNMQFNERLVLLVGDRSNMPPLKMKRTWHDLLHVWLDHDASKGQNVPPAFPWTMEHARDVTNHMGRRSLVLLQADFDAKGHNKSILPADISMQTAVDVWRRYWKYEGHMFPERLVEMGVQRPLDPVAAPFAPGQQEGHVTPKKAVEKQGGRGS